MYIYHRELYFHVSVNLLFYHITIVLSGMLIDKCYFSVSCQFNANSGIIDLLATPAIDQA